MPKKIISLIISVIVLSISFISLISAEDYIYAGNGMVVYPDYIIRTVCKPYMPCGVERINIPNHNSVNNNAKNREISENSPPGFFRIFSPNYDPAQDRNKNNNPTDVVYTKTNQYYAKPPQYNTKPTQYNSPPEIKHFPNTDNTEKNYDSKGNWIGDKKDYNQKRNKKLGFWHIFN